MRYITGIVLLIGLLGLSRAARVSAQSAAVQTASNPAGYQYQVPSDWVAGAVTDPNETFMGSPSLAEAAYVVVRSPAGNTTADRLQALTAAALAPAGQQSNYVVTNPSSPVTVAGADAADGGAANFVDQFGMPAQEFIIAAIKGTAGYVLVVDVPTAVDTATPALAQAILGSFKFTPSGPAPLGSSVAPPPATAATLATAASAAPVATTAAATAPAPAAAAAVTPVYASNLSAGSADWLPLRGAELVAVDPTHGMTPGAAALKVTTPGTDVPEGTRVDRGSVTAGTVYTVTLWVYAASGTTLQVALGVNDVGVYAMDEFTGTGTWQQVTLAGTAQASGENQVQVRTSDSAQATMFWIDSVEVDPGLTSR